MNENKIPSPSESIADANTEQAPAVADAAAGRERRRNGLLIGAAAAVALIAVGGSAYAIGASVGTENRSAATSSSHDSERDGGELSEGSRDAPERATGGGSDSNLPPADAASLRAAAEQAIAETQATGAISIDVERGGYEIEVRLPDGSEPDVFVAVDGTVTTGTDRPDGDRPDPLLELDDLDGIVEAALAASTQAGAAEGTIDSISTTDDRGVAYDVSVRLADGRDADIHLAADLTVVATDIDDD